MTPSATANPPTGGIDQRDAPGGGCGDIHGVIANARSAQHAKLPARIYDPAGDLRFAAAHQTHRALQEPEYGLLIGRWRRLHRGHSLQDFNGYCVYRSSRYEPAIGHLRSILYEKKVASKAHQEVGAVGRDVKVVAKRHEELAGARQ